VRGWSVCDTRARLRAHRPTLRGALGGCLHLLRSPLDAETAREIASALLRELHVPSLGAAERLLSLQCLSEAVRRHPAAAAALGAPLLEGAVAAVDGEKDPRCLAVAFDLWPPLVALFHPSSPPMAACAEDLHDIVSCYFPISFSGGAGRGAAGAPDREALAASLARAMTASHAFAPFALPLVLGKLALPGEQGEPAVLDALEVLGCCTRAFPAPLLAPHIVPAWRALRGLILPAPPSAADAGPPLSGAVRLRARRELTHLLRAQSCASARELLTTALGDEFVARSLQLLVAEGGGGEAEQARLTRTLGALAALLSSLAAASVDASRAVCVTALPSVFAATPTPKAALRLAVHVAGAAAVAVAHAHRAAGAAGFSLGSPLADGAPGLLRLFSAAAAGDAEWQGEWEWEEAEEEEEGLQAEQEALRQSDLPHSLLGVAGLAALLRLPPACQALSREEGDAALASLVAAALNPEPRLQRFATACLASLARRAHALELLARAALAPLLAAAGGSGDSLAAALRVLQAVARVAPVHIGVPACEALSRSELGGEAMEDEGRLARLRTLAALLEMAGDAAAHVAAPFAHHALQRAAEAGAALGGCVAAATAACDPVQQAALARAAAETLSALGSSPGAPPPRAALAVLSALRPGPPTEACQPCQLLARLLAHAAAPGAAAAPEVLEAATSLANKAADGEAVARLALEMAGVLTTLSLAADETAPVDAAAVVACCAVCGAICAGLIPRGVALACDELPLLLLPLLRLPDASRPGVAAAAAAALSGALLRPPPPHALCRVLWQQRFFASTLGRLQDSLRGAVGHGARLGALLALAQLLRCAPRAPMLQAAPALSPLLPECLLAMLAQPAGDEALLAAPLAAAGELLCEEEGRTALAEHAGPLLRALSAVAREGRSTPPDARATALQAITACASLPYAKTYPHRRALLRDLAAATDDGRRVVRAAAVAARVIWAALPDV